MKILVIHEYPDLDALCGAWLIKKFGGKLYKDAKIEYVPNGKTLNNAEVDIDENIIHIDTGGGKFDHHDSTDRTSASRKVYEYLDVNDAVVDVIVEYVTAIDHFEDASWPNPLSDHYDFSLAEVFNGVKLQNLKDYSKYTVWAFEAFGGVYESLKGKYDALARIDADGIEFGTRYGKGLAIQTFNDEVIRVGLKKGFVVVFRRDPQKHYIRVKAHPNSEIDLSYFYNKLQALDPQATWYLHADKKQLMNGTSTDESRKISELDYELLLESLQQALN